MRHRNELGLGHLPFHHLVDQADDLARLGVPLGLELGVNQLPIDGDLEAASVRWDEVEFLDHVLELLE